eukprot:TRINITY_DN48972_c0_g1_i1.p1 TRINITY_DN48972_c0_g1~~TRINITY_DN48972_c0_g1_i1.p1  ORF type:complete len:437 (-),score=31.59 TRINITY_DN48972_c0_g1_i1:74-1270(-)
MVGLVASAYAISQLVSSAPLGVIMRHCSYGKSACLALGLLVMTALLSFGVQSVFILFVIRLLGGIGASAFDISRKAYMAANVPNSVRGRVVALLASMQKWAVMVAAGLSGVIAQHIATRYIFLVQAGLTGTALLLIGCHDWCLEPTRFSSTTGSLGTRSLQSGAVERATPATALSLVEVVRGNWRSLLGAGGYCAFLSGLRNTWAVALPLQGHNIGLSKAHIGFSVAAFRCIDASVTLLVAGHVMQRYGLKVAALPSMLLMATAFTMLACSTNTLSLGIALALYGLGNGLCGGILNGFATSLAPPNARTQFMGVWRTVTALGGITVPPLFGIMSDFLSFRTAALFTSGIGLLSIAWVLLLVQDSPPSCRPPAEVPLATVNGGSVAPEVLQDASRASGG